MSLPRNVMEHARSGGARLICTMFSGTTSQHLVDALAGRSRGQLAETLEGWLHAVGYWRGNIRTDQRTGSRPSLKYWHQDETTGDERPDRLSLPFIELKGARIRGFAERSELERIWRLENAAGPERDVEDTTSVRCIRWLRKREFARPDLPDRPMCVIHPGEIVLSLMLTQPGLVIPDSRNPDSEASRTLIPVTKDQILTWAQEWLTPSLADSEMVPWCPDTFREAFFGSVASAEQLGRWLAQAFGDAEPDPLAAAVRFHTLATSEVPDMAERTSAILRVWPEEWRLVGTRAVILWPLLRISGVEFRDGLEVYALVVPQPNAVLDRARTLAIRESIELLFQQAMASELLAFHRDRIAVRQAKALHEGIRHELNGLANLIVTTFADHEKGPLVVAETRAAIKAADAYWRAVDQGSSMESVGQIFDRVEAAMRWPDLVLISQSSVTNWQSLEVNNAIEFVLIELCRNAYNYGDDSEAAVRVTVSIESDNEGRAVRRVAVTHPGFLDASKAIDTRAGLLPAGEPFKGRRLVTDLVMSGRHLNGHWSLQVADGLVVAVVEPGARDG